MTRASKRPTAVGTGVLLLISAAIGLVFSGIGCNPAAGSKGNLNWYSARFIPVKSEYGTNEPVWVKFELKNTGGATAYFQQGGKQSGVMKNPFRFRNDQFEFHATLSGRPAESAGDSENMGGMFFPFQLDPGNVFVEGVDLKNWFSFDRAGTYEIKGSYGLTLYPNGSFRPQFRPQDAMWTDHASADFKVVIK